MSTCKENPAISSFLLRGRLQNATVAAILLNAPTRNNVHFIWFEYLVSFLGRLPEDHCFGGEMKIEDENSEIDTTSQNIKISPLPSDRNVWNFVPWQNRIGKPPCTSQEGDFELALHCCMQLLRIRVTNVHGRSTALNCVVIIAKPTVSYRHTAVGYTVHRSTRGRFLPPYMPFGGFACWIHNLASFAVVYVHQTIWSSLFSVC